MRVIKEDNLKRVADYIIQFVGNNNGESPSLNDIIFHTGIAKTTAYRYIKELNKRGIVSYSGKNTLTIKGQEKYKVLYSKLAILGTIPCGMPEDYKEDIQGYVAIPNEWVDGKCYLLRVAGDSMIDIGIRAGDLVLIKMETNAYDKQVVAVLTENGTTLKRYMVGKDGRPWLLAENATYPEERRKIFPHEIKVLGVALKVIRDIK